MKRFLHTYRYDRKGRLVIKKGIRIGKFKLLQQEIRLTPEELELIGLKDTYREKATGKE